MYYTLRSFDVMERMASEGIPVQSHIGLIPTFSHHYGGLRVFGRTAEEALQVWDTLKRMEDVGVFAVEVECLAEEVLLAVNDKTSVVTFSLGSGAGGDAVFHSLPIFAARQAKKTHRQSIHTPLAMWAACISRSMTNA